MQQFDKAGDDLADGLLVAAAEVGAELEVALGVSPQSLRLPDLSIHVLIGSWRTKSR
jgi:hypothetical protein